MIKILKPRRRNPAMAAAVPVSIFFFLTLLLFAVSLFISPQSLSFQNPRPSPFNLSTTATADHHRVSSTVKPHQPILESKSVLFPEWIVFTIIPKSSSQPLDDGGYHCVFQDNATSPAEYAGTASGDKKSYKCVMPISLRGLRQFLTPALIKSDSVNVTEIIQSAAAVNWTSRPQLPRWNWLVYDSLSTASDVVVFAKNVNRPSHVRSPDTLRCVFTNEVNSNQVKTQVTSSDQEVFRCTHPPSSQLLPEGSRITLTLEVIEEVKGCRKNVQIPSVATYEKTSSTQRPVSNSPSLCVCTMVHNVGKFLKEWVMYHSAIGVEKFILYDNDSDDGTSKTYVPELVDSGYNIETVFWPWPKAQEAGFSHSVISSRSSCYWMVFVDVDEFVFSPTWTDSTKPSHDMFSTMLYKTGRRSKQVGQVMIQCHDFGPSNRTSHPRNGVTQGYTCRRKLEERHKSIVRLDAVDESLQNSVHHFKIKSDIYKSQKVSPDRAVVNHYKYQAWPEFKTKFKRRVSTYVVDWTENINMKSKDRTPGLGVEAVEPQGWAMKFCEVADTRLQLLTRKWFGRKVQNQSNVKMAWER